MLRALGHTTFAGSIFSRRTTLISQRLPGRPTALRIFSTMSSSGFRLPSNVQPTDYDLTIKTDLQKETFEGLVKIRQVNSFFS